MQEILPRFAPEPPLISPAARGELSRRSPSELAVQKSEPIRNGLVGSSRMWLLPASVSAALRSPALFTGLRNTSATRPSLVATTIALRSLAEFQMLPAR